MARSRVGVLFFARDTVCLHFWYSIQAYILMAVSLELDILFAETKLELEKKNGEKFLAGRPVSTLCW